jgi:uncharacterized protein
VNPVKRFFGTELRAPTVSYVFVAAKLAATQTGQRPEKAPPNMDRVAAGIGAGILSIGVLGTAGLVTNTWKENRQLNQTLSVTGSAKRSIQADLGILNGSLGAGGLTQQEANRELASQATRLVAAFGEQGFKADTIERSPVSLEAVYELNEEGSSTGVIRSWNAYQRFEVRSNDVQAIKKLSLNIGDVVNDGISFQVSQPQYLYTQLAKIRIDMQEAATKDAKERAGRIVKATGQELGTLRDASMGVIQVTAKDATEFEDTGSLDTSSIDKDITAVVRLSFAIK